MVLEYWASILYIPILLVYAMSLHSKASSWATILQTSFMASIICIMRSQHPNSSPWINMGLCCGNKLIILLKHWKPYFLTNYSWIMNSAIKRGELKSSNNLRNFKYWIQSIDHINFERGLINCFVVKYAALPRKFIQYFYFVRLILKRAKSKIQHLSLSSILNVVCNILMYTMFKILERLLSRAKI